MSCTNEDIPNAKNVLKKSDRLVRRTSRAPRVSRTSHTSNVSNTVTTIVEESIEPTNVKDQPTNAEDQPTKAEDQPTKAEDQPTNAEDVPGVATQRLVSSTILPERHALHIMAFNSLKFRVGDQRLAMQWLGLVERMATNDIVLVSEIPAGQAEDRATTMSKMLSAIGDSSWTYVLSKAAGTSNVDSNKEVHAAFIRDGVDLISYRTMHKIGETRLDYAPLQIKVVDKRFEREVEFVLTSVHFPPASRKNERDTQVAAFLNSYPKEADARMHTPFTSKGASDARLNPTVHVVGGDWNAYPAAIANVDTNPWKFYVGSEVATSSGRQSFDHFAVNRDSSNSFSISWDVVELQFPQNSSKGEIGLSDHHPIELTVKGMPLVKKI